MDKITPFSSLQDKVIEYVKQSVIMKINIEAKEFLVQKIGNPRQLVGPEVKPRGAASPEELQAQKTDGPRRQV